jgi:hypothetical protein
MRRERFPQKEKRRERAARAVFDRTACRERRG